jgi:hypothetical protein
LSDGRAHQVQAAKGRDIDRRVKVEAVRPDRLDVCFLDVSMSGKLMLTFAVAMLK